MTTVPADDMARLLTVLRDEYGGSVDALLAAARKAPLRVVGGAGCPTRWW